ncbi:MAG: hypothetical protein KGI51_00140 [Rhodospirillales bacterium]|nr:hypothetical protein [Rhodospirillales bacterium]
MPAPAGSDEAFADAVSLLYDAAASPELWPDALDATEAMFGAMTAHIFAWDTIAAKRLDTFGARSFVRTDQDWDYYHRINPRRRILASRPLGYILPATSISIRVSSVATNTSTSTAFRWSGVICSG